MKRLIFCIAIAHFKLTTCEIKPSLLTDEYVKTKINDKKLILNEMDIEDLQRGCFRNAPLVEIINLNSNKIRAINENVFNNLSVRVLDLSNNSIANVAKSAFDDMSKLTWISLFNNSLKIIDDWFKNCHSLKFISLMSNNIEEIPGRAFQNLGKSIDALILRDNNVSTIQAGVFENIEEFGMIDFWNNRLESLPTGLFPNLRKGIVVDFGANQLKCVSDMGYFGKIAAVGLLKNPLECDCVKQVETFAKTSRNVYVQYDDCDKVE